MEIIDLFQKKRYNYEIKCKAKMLELLECILSQFEEKKISENEISSDILASVRNYIDNNYLSVLTLDYLSSHFFINKYTLLRKFKKMYGKNPIEYYREKRIDYAKKMLINSNFSVSEIGEMLNFTDVYSFSRFFKLRTGVSPAKFKK